METAITILVYLGLILLCNISWYLYCKDKESKHKKVEFLLNNKLLKQNCKSKFLEHRLKTCEQYMEDVCSGDSEREEHAKYLHSVTSGWAYINFDNEWSEKELIQFYSQMSEILNLGTRQTIDEEKSK